MHKKRNIVLQSLLYNLLNKKYNVKTLVNDDGNMMKKVVSWLFIIALACMILSGCVEEKTVEEKTSQFDPNGNLVVIEGKGKYNFIQDAIDAASDGDTINVHNGIYRETLVLNKSINLVGENKDKTLLVNNGSILEDSVIIWVTANNCSVKGFKIEFFNTSSDTVGIKVSSSGNIISDNTILYTSHGNDKYAIYVDRYSENNSIIHNNISESSYGIYITYAFYNDVSRNIIVNSSYGIYLRNTYISTVSWNNISSCLQGIRLKGATGSKIFRNMVVGNLYGMYLCCGTQGNTVYYNTFNQSTKENANDTFSNKWDNGEVGNYWDDYTEKYPEAKQQGDVWDTPYNISDGRNQDRFPLVHPVQT